MDMSLLQALKSWISLSWDFFTEITIPGTSFTFAALFVGLFLADLGLRFLFMVLGLSFSSDDLSLFHELHEKDMSGNHGTSWWDYLHDRDFMRRSRKVK